MKLLNYTYYANKSKPTLVILHGLLGSCDNWNTMAKKLSDYFNIYCFDLRNHGNSFHSASMSYKDMAYDVNYSMDYLSIKPDFIIGHSMGGKTAIRLLQEYSGFSKVIIVDIAPVKYARHHEDVINALKYVSFDSVATRSELDLELKTYVDLLPTRQLLMKNISRDNKGLFKWKCNHKAIINYYDEVMDISHLNKIIQIPALFIKGGQSEYIQMESFSEIKTLFLDVKLSTIESAGHWVQVQAPERFLQECLGFLN